jgi:hypothetical protein
VPFGSSILTKNFASRNRVNDEFWERRDIIVLQIASFKSLPEDRDADESFDRPRPSTTSYGLVLRPTLTDQFDDTYERIGVARLRGLWPKDVVWDLKTISIV